MNNWKSIVHNTAITPKIVCDVVLLLINHHNLNSCWEGYVKFKCSLKGFVVMGYVLFYR